VNHFKDSARTAQETLHFGYRNKCINVLRSKHLCSVHNVTTVCSLFRQNVEILSVKPAGTHITATSL